MLCFPCCKINLGLNVTEKRPDGYHNLETVFYPIPLEDALEVSALPADSTEPFQLHQYGNAVEVEPEKNLVVKAYYLLKHDFDLPPIDIHLIKHIPSGAGLGGGSSDAANMLVLLNKLFNLQLSKTELESYASTLGADCAFFVRSVPTFATGIGNIFTPVDLNLKGYQIVIVKPNVFVSTPEAYRGITPKHPEVSLTEIIKKPVSQWDGMMINDFEANIFPLHPEIREIKERLYQSGALYAAMSGSGSSVFGLYAAGASTPLPTDFTGMFYFKATL